MLRNLLLNWAILVPTFAALLLLPILNSFLLSWAGKMVTPNNLLIAAAALAFLSLLSIGLNLPGNFKTQPRSTVLTNYASIGLLAGARRGAFPPDFWLRTASPKSLIVTLHY